MDGSGDGNCGPLSHDRVLDMTRILAGPGCPQSLGVDEIEVSDLRTEGVI